MKIHLEQSPAWAEPEIVVRCSRLDEPLRRVMAAIRLCGGQLAGRLGDETHLLNAADVYYCEAVDGKVFLCTETAVYETALRLYEIEARLEEADFFRASKSVVANLAKITGVRPLFNGRLEARMQNGERILISRQYVPALKGKLGL